MGWQQFAKDYLSFTRRERVGIIIVFILLAVIILLPEIRSKKNGSSDIIADTAWMTAVKKLEIKNTRQGNQENDSDSGYVYQFDRSKSYSAAEQRGSLFYFDPNTISAEGWKKLGLRDKTIHTIQNYLGKGGSFRKPEDLQKIYGLHTDEYERLFPFIRITSAIPGNAEQAVSERKPDTAVLLKNYSSRYTIIDINTADTGAFISLPGIGSKLAARIVNFREKLGGFYSIEQIREIYGLPDSAFQKIKQWLKLENTSVKKLNINTVTLDELKAHPYIKYSIANPIIAYRNEHGLFSKIEDIKKVMAVTEEVYQKIIPYLVTQ